ncbi:RagB/SusD family nutrient uptake outer membrane protein [Pedobacter nutrimenti]|uniref:RagB/SusD family nutrient uptake outer membrane protein n=1 Tax=Pedobacter nutrimenti TaxID=1241337 RepID=UPI00292D4F46|nr:RagB/SusD family nutrient uptake outer membrane protein [Pedobacter nutrimenti]
MRKLFSNRIKILACGLLLALGTLAGCKKLIEIPANPPTQIIREQVFTDSATTISAVAGVYSCTPGGSGIPYSDGRFTVVTAISGHEVGPGGGDLAQFFNYTVTQVNQNLSSLWTAPYTEIYQVNDVMAGITNNSNLSASLVKQLTGEMKVVRAFCYFNMVNLFGGVPLVTTTDYKITAQLPRASVAAVYHQILTDLDDAVKKLPVTYPSDGHVRANLYTAVALQAKVNLYLGKWQAAYNEADSVINSGLFDLTTTPLSDVFLEGSAEAIWQVPIQNSDYGSGEASSFVPYSSDQTPKYVVTEALLNQFETGDQRLENWLGFNVIDGKKLYYPAKYKDLQTTSPATNYMLLRFAEMYLIRAEAAAQLGNLSQALADVNTLRDRAGLDASTADETVQTAVLAAIRKERCTEMCFEFGSRWFDLNRTSADNKYPANGQAPAVLAGWQPNFSVYPLPQAQLQLNSHLIQNPGYH